MNYDNPDPVLDRMLLDAGHSGYTTTDAREMIAQDKRQEQLERDSRIWLGRMHNLIQEASRPAPKPKPQRKTANYKNLARRFHAAVLYIKPKRNVIALAIAFFGIYLHDSHIDGWSAHRYWAENTLWHFFALFLIVRGFFYAVDSRTPQPHPGA